jgi:iron complex outermembrane recepter protein
MLRLKKFTGKSPDAGTSGRLAGEMLRNGAVQALQGIWLMESSRSIRILVGSVSSVALLWGIGLPGVAAAEETPELHLKTVVVTARKRQERLQDVPASVQAFGEEEIERLNITKFEDYARFAPSVSFNTQGPGQTKLVIRGVAESSASRSGQSSAGIYLDDQPITSNAQTPDVRIVDIERIEVLSGPQGTLYGASSQSGTLKIITNKPDASRNSGSVDATIKSMPQGDSSYDLQGVANLPLVKDKLAVRVVGFYGEESGYVDNVLGATPGGTVDNAAIAQSSIDTIKTFGGRAAARYDFDGNWSATASYAFQTSDADGLSDYDPLVGDLKAVKFYDESRKDEWNQAALTVEGDIGFADLIVTASHFRRDIDSIADNTAYMQFLSGLAAEDPAYYAFYDFGPDPVGFYDLRLKERRSALETRLSSGDDGSRWNWIIGAFYEKIEGDTLAGAHIKDYALSPSFASVAAYIDAPTDIYFYQKVAYDQDQLALFGEVSYKLTEKLTGTLGARYFDANNDQSIYTEIPQGLPVEDSLSPAPENGFTPKLSLAWQQNEDMLVYATYSQGFRLGGANRDKPGLAVPKQYDADKLTNYELGLKTSFADKRVTLNAATFFMKWDDFQLEVRNPDPATFFFVTANVGQAEIKGIEAQLDTLVTDRLQVGLAGTLLSAELSQPSEFLGAPKGARLPVTPEKKFSLYADYRIPAEALGGDFHLRGDYSYTSDSVNNVDPASAQSLDAYSLANLQVSFDTGNWSLNVFLNNAFDERGVTYISPSEFKNSINVVRPREFGLTLSKSF